MTSDRDAVERRVLDVVGSLVTELRGAGPPAPVALSDSLERDLGLGSLERVELLVRLERASGVRLPDAVVIDAVTPGDLVASLLRGAPVSADAAPVTTPAPVLSDAVPAPADARTLTEALRWHADRTPERAHVYLQEEGEGGRWISYGELWGAASEAAAALAAHGVGRGDTVALMLRTERAFFDAFFGILLAGAVPVPLYPPVRADRIEEYASRQAAILRNARTKVLVAFAAARPVASLLRGRVPALREVLAADRLTATGGPPPAVSVAGDPALIQYTSGSTGDPKGVLLTHANLLANIRAIGQGVDVRPDDVVVSWLPLYHDMGLIGAWLAPLYFGVPAVIMSPLAFLTRPARWLQAMHAHRGTMSPAPNFAYDLCVRRIADEEIAGVDLASWRLAMNGSEPVSAETIEAFARRFAPYGLRPEAMCPVYGLAEASVGLTISPPGRLPRIDSVARAPFEARRLIVPAGAEDGLPLRFVSCGRPLPGHDIRIVDAAGKPVGDRVEGGIQFRGPSVSARYFDNPDATRATFGTEWADSGDFGYQADGELYITGRAKDVIIRGGRNVAPQEVEEVVGDVAGVRKGCVAAFGIHDPAIGTERMVVVAETRTAGRERWEQLRAAITGRVNAAIGLPPDVVVLAPPGTVLKTSSGKIRRSAVRDAYLKNELFARRPAVALQWLRLAAEAGLAYARTGVRLAACLLLTGYAALILLVTLPPFWILLFVVPRGRPADRVVRIWSRLALALARLTPRVSGAGRLHGLGPAVLVANHASYLDSLVLLGSLRRDFRFVAKRALRAYPILGAALDRAGHLTVERADLSQRLTGADEITDALRAGTSIAVFPEGGFFPPAGILPFRLGAFRAAVDSGRPIVPIALRGTRHVLRDGAWLLRPGPIEVIVGEPLAPEGDGWPEMVRLRDRARATIAEGAGEPLRDSV